MKQNNLTIKDWSIDDRPREKFMLKGTQSVSDAELIAILLGSGTRSESAVDVAKKILYTANNSLHELGAFTIHDFKKLKGVGPVKAITLCAALELGRRRNVSEAKHAYQITSSKDLFNILQPQMADLVNEEFRVLYLNRNNAIIADKIVSSGGVSGTVVDIKIIGKTALELLASNIIISHNHPSGNTKPSNADIEITKKVKEAAHFFDCTLLDHIIIAKNDYFSFADEGIL